MALVNACVGVSAFASQICIKGALTNLPGSSWHISGFALWPRVCHKYRFLSVSLDELLVSVGH